MNSVKWDVLRKRVSLALPLVQALIVYYGVTTADAAGLWISLVSVVVTGVALSADPRIDTANVSRETSRDLETAMGTGKKTTVPCEYLHGSADAHVLGCEGWRGERS